MPDCNNGIFDISSVKCFGKFDYRYLLTIGLFAVTSFIACKNSETKIRSRFEDGTIETVYECPNKYDTLNYTMKIYYPNGKIRNLATVINGKYSGKVFTYSTTGGIHQIDSITEACNVNPGRYNTILTRYYENGNISQRYVVKDGRLNGITQQYTEKGILAKSFYLIDDSIKNGEYKEFYENYQFPELPHGNKYVAFKQKVLLHYLNLEPNFTAIKSELSSQLAAWEHDKKSATPWKLEPFHHLNRYYHKISKSKVPVQNKYQEIQGLQELLVNYSQTTNLSRHDQIAFRSISNILRNTFIDLKLRQELDNNLKNIATAFTRFLLGKQNEAYCEYMVTQRSMPRRLQRIPLFPSTIVTTFCFHL